MSSLLNQFEICCASVNSETTLPIGYQTLRRTFPRLSHLVYIIIHISVHLSVNKSLSTCHEQLQIKVSTLASTTAKNITVFHSNNFLCHFLKLHLVNCFTKKNENSKCYLISLTQFNVTNYFVVTITSLLFSFFVCLWVCCCCCCCCFCFCFFVCFFCI